MPVIITKNKEDKNTGPVDNLPDTKNKNGFLYRLVKRSKKVAMYSQEIAKLEPGMKKGIIGYEVFQITITKPSSIKQKHGKKAGMWYQYPATEKFPGNEDFGKTAWAYHTEKAANRKFIELSK